MKFRSLLSLALAGLMIFPAASFLAAGDASAETPLLQEGKKSVYQRVVTHPGAKLYAGPDAGAQVLEDHVKTFSVMYIYARQDSRMQVGTSSTKADGWIDTTLVTEWNQAITMLFTDRTGRDPVLFFRDHESLQKTCEAPSVAKQIREYQEELAQKGDNLPADYPVVASEPADAAVSEKNFYLLPVLSMDSQYSELKLVEVASINPGVSAGVEETKQPAAPQQQQWKPKESDLRTGFCFVIDTTISMKPYIDSTLALVRKLYDELERTPYSDKMAFAVVAFRGNTKQAPGIEYTSRVICDFTTVKDRKVLEDALAQVKEATVSTKEFNEDSFAGIKEGADNLSWSDYSSRVMVMVSDAGPLGADNPDSQTGLSPETLSDYLKTNKIYLTALHVKSPAGKKNHKYAADAYQRLTRQSDNQASYIPIDAPTTQKGAAQFESAGRALAKGYSQILTATAEGRFVKPPKQEPQQQKKISRALTPEDEAVRIAMSTGYAMQLQFMGNQKNVTAPTVMKAWIADADLAKMEAGGGAPVIAAEPAVLLTKGQLSNLYKQLKILLRGSEEAFLNGKVDLFAQLKSAAAQMSRDPNQYAMHPDQNLQENGLLDEVLEDLPYKSQVAALTQKDWEDMSTGARQDFIRRIKALLARYEQYDKDSTHWESFGVANPNDWVYRVPLNMLP